jgi:uncharacterized protein (TIGR03435 family)
VEAIAVGIAITVSAGAPGVQAQTAFEVASVKPNRSSDNRRVLLPPEGARFHAVNVTVLQLIQRAYDVQGPITATARWMQTQGFDVTATASTTLSAASLGVMLQGLLRERFKLDAHLESRDGVIYALTRERRDGLLGAGLVASSRECPGAQVPLARTLPQMSGDVPLTCGMLMTAGILRGQGVQAPQLVKLLSRVLERPVVDQANLAGGYDIELRWTPDRAARGNDDAPALTTALREQWGLRIAARRAAIPTLIIDHIERPSPD